MSIEREFLKKLRYATHLENDLRKELEYLLSQPDQEPVAWMYKQMDCHGEWGTIFKVDKPYISYHDIKDIVPVYTAPPKPESEQQPEAWIIVNKETGYRTQVSHFPDSYDKNTFEVTPLYTAPPKREQTEQEPVAYVYAYDYLDSLYYATDKDVADYPRISRDGKPLYSSPPKLERINHDDILDRSIDGSFEYRDGFMDGVMFAENHHGIGG